MCLTLMEHIRAGNPNTWLLNPAYREELPAFYAGQIEDADAELLVAESASKVIGMALGRVRRSRNWEVERYGRIDDVWVDNEYRRQGICRALIKGLLDFFKSKDIEYVSLEYADGNIEAERTWQTLGFKPVVRTARARLEEIEL